MKSNCKKCNSFNIKKNGHDKNKNQLYYCKDCESGFVFSTDNRLISDDIEILIRKALLERILSRGICRTFTVRIIKASLTSEDKDFLLAFKKVDPDWSKFFMSDAQFLPAIKWKPQALFTCTNVKTVKTGAFVSAHP